jgi:hypothetical protein
MPSPRKISRARLAAYGVLVILVTLVAIPAYLHLGPAWQPVAVRVACAMIVIVGSTRVVRRVRRALEDDAPSPLDVAPPAPRPSAPDEQFLRLRADLVESRRSWRYFDRFVRPRLQALGATAPPPPPLPRWRWSRQRGPSWPALERLIAEAERRP